MVALVLTLTIATWIVRGFDLDQFLTPDEPFWLARSGNFYRALTHGQFANTFQREHPGVTTTWVGTAGFLWRYPEYATEAPPQLEWFEADSFLRAEGYAPLEMIESGRVVVVLAITLALAASFYFLYRLAGVWPALVGGLLIALDPFHAGLSRLLHVDALMSSFMLLSVLAVLSYLYRGRRRLDLLVSAVAAGLAWLTKSPAWFLVPFVGIVGVLELWRRRSDGIVQTLKEFVPPLLAWGVIAGIVFVALWPAMWVDPLNTLTRIFSQAATYAEEGHALPIYFNGAVIDGSPGLAFYPATYLWRATPLALLGLVVAGIALVARVSPLDESEVRYTVSALALFAAGFTLFMNLGAKQFDRYLLPVYAPLDVIAGIGLVAGVRWLQQVRDNSGWQRAMPALLGFALLVQSANVLTTFPYYLSYYNPLLGGGERAEQTMMIGWGEGLDQAAAYLNTKPDAGDMYVMSEYSGPVFEYFFEGDAGPLQYYDNPADWQRADYVVYYENRWQRKLPAPQFVEYFSSLEPEHVVQLNGAEYARIYNMQDVPPFDPLLSGDRSNAYGCADDLPSNERTTWPPLLDWAGTIRLMQMDAPNQAEPGDTISLTLALRSLAPLDRNLNLLVRLIAPDGSEILRDEGWPAGRPMSSWEPCVEWDDTRELQLPDDLPAGYYRIELSMYDPETLGRLPVRAPRSGAAYGDSVPIQYVAVGDLPTEPAMALDANLGDVARLAGADVQTESGQRVQESETLVAGAGLRVRLYWTATAPMETAYTTFVHLVGPDGQLVAQHDKQPLDDFYPTTHWSVGRLVSDSYQLAIPPDASAGTYELRAGMYDLDTGTRLPVSQNGEPVGDSVRLTTVTVE